MKSGRYLKSVRDALPAAVRAHLDRAFGGDALAARRLMIVAPKRLRGHIAFLAYQAKIANPAYREIVKAVWHKETRHLLTGFWRQEVLRRMLARADFRSSRAPRAGDRLSAQWQRTEAKKVVAADLCWSLSRERALLDAIVANPSKPRFLQATIDPSDIVYWNNGDGEQEVVSKRAVLGAVVVDATSLLRGPIPISQTG